MLFWWEEMNLAGYKSLDPKWHDWNRVKSVCAHLSTVIFDRVAEKEAEEGEAPRP